MGFLSQSFGIIDPHQNGMISIRKATHQFEHVSQENAKEYYDFYVYPTLGRSENRVKKHARGARDMGMPFWRVPTLNGSNSQTVRKMMARIGPVARNLFHATQVSRGNFQVNFLALSTSHQFKGQCCLCKDLSSG